MDSWKACSVLILLLGSHLLAAGSSFSQTLRAPERDVGDVQKLPSKADETLKTRRIQEALPCEGVYDEMKKGFENLQRLCSDPGGFSGESLRLHFLREQWVKKGCAEREMDPALKRHAKYMLETGIPSVQARCVESCFQKATDSFNALRCQVAAIQCRECCGFSPPSDRNGCSNRCADAEGQCRRAIYTPDPGAARKAEGYRDALSSIVRTMEEIAKSVIRSLR